MERPKLAELTDIILKEMESAGFKEKTRRFYGVLFNKLKRIAKGRGEEYYTEGLGRAFMEDDSHIIPGNTERYYHERTYAYIRCIKFLESYLKNGVVDWTPALPTAEFPVKSEQLMGSFKSYLKELENRKLKPNTVDGYRSFAYYFIEYLENSRIYITVRYGERGCCCFYCSHMHRALPANQSWCTHARTKDISWPP